MDEDERTLHFLLHCVYSALYHYIALYRINTANNLTTSLTNSCQLSSIQLNTAPLTQLLHSQNCSGTQSLNCSAPFHTPPQVVCWKALKTLNLERRY